MTQSDRIASVGSDTCCTNTTMQDCALQLDDADEFSFIADALPHLTRLLGDDDDTAQIAIDVLWDLLSDRETKQLVMSMNVLQTVVDILRRDEAGENYQVSLPLLALWQAEDFRAHLSSDTLRDLLESLCCEEAIQSDQVATLLSKLCKDRELRQLLTNAGVIPLLVSIMEKSGEENQRRAAITLWNLSEDDAVNPVVLSMTCLPALLRHLATMDKLRNEINMNSSIPVFVKLLRDGTGELMESALEVLSALDLRTLSSDECQQIVNEGALQPLINILYGCGENQEKALKLLQGLEHPPKNKSAMLSAGVLGALVSVVKSCTPEIQSTAVRFLASICHPSATSMVDVAVTEIDAIVDLSRDASGITSEKCFMTLAYLARNTVNRKRILATDVTYTAVRTLRGDFTLHRYSAAVLLSNLAVDDKGRSVVAASEAIPTLVSILSCNSVYEREKAIYALINIARHSQENKASIVEHGGIEILASITRSGNETTKTLAIFTLILLSIKSDYNKQKIAATGIIPELIGFLQLDKDGYYKKVLTSRSLTLLKSLAVNDNNEKMIVAAGAVEALLPLIVNREVNLSWLAITTLHNLAVAREHKAMISATEGCIESLLLRVRGTDEKLSIAALGVLTNLAFRCNDSKKTIGAQCGADGLVGIARDNNSEKCLRTLSLLNELSVVSEN